MLRIGFWILGIVVIAGAGLFAAFQFSPWPGALLIRWTFDEGSRRASAALAPHVPAGIAERLDLVYDPADRDARLDLFYPAIIDGTSLQLTTIVWVHGGGWVSGDENQIGNYARVLAARGFTVVSVNYTIAPEATYPTPVRQVHKALGYLAANATELHVDPTRFVLAGDSGGAHIAAQVANTIAVASYAGLVGVEPEIARPQLIGMLLFCGAYTIDGLNLDSALGGFLRTALWAYSGGRDFQSDDYFRSAWVVNFVDGNFPPSFITVGNGDPLRPQSVIMADRLESLGVRVDRLFFPEEYEPALPHEYQFDLDSAEGAAALERAIAFLRTI